MKEGYTEKCVSDIIFYQFIFPSGSPKTWITNQFQETGRSLRKAQFRKRVLEEIFASPLRALLSAQQQSKFTATERYS